MASTNATAPSSPSPPPPAESPPPPPPPPNSPPPPPPPKSKSSPPSRSPPPPKSKSSSSKKSPPSPKSLKNSPSSRKPSKHKDDSNLPVILGVAIGVGLFLILLLISSIVACIRKKRKKHDTPSSYYDVPPGLNKGGYYNGGVLPKYGTPSREQMGKIPLPPGAMAPPGGGGWHQTPPPPAMYSGDMNSDIYSGPYGTSLPPPSPTVSLGFSKSIFTYEELSAATNGFSQANLLGQGGFGYVHKGVLPNGKVVAVKQLKSGSGQGEREFKAEVDIISRVHHRHLVSLVGYSIAGQQRMLVYEFVANQTLEHHLHGKGLPTMNWPSRLKIALGSAKGLAYLHEDCHPRIIHRDIKAANILLDNNFEAMVADFGLAKLSNDTNTHVSTRVMGTFGYLAPEYASSGKLTEKSDVFSFGVMLLELITGRQPVDHTQTEDSLVDWARPLMNQALDDDNFDELVDPNLENYDQTEMARMIASAAACVRHSAKRRPKMSQIVRALEGDMSIEHLNEGTKPGDSRFFSSGSEYDSGSYTSNMRQVRRAGLESNDYTNGYSTGSTNEYGLDPSHSSSSGETRPTGKQRMRNYSDD